MSKQEIITWIANRLTEKSTWSGLSLAVISLLVILGAPVIKTLAWFGLGYGVYSMATQG